jgi:hypothetical protein
MKSCMFSQHAAASSEGESCEEGRMSIRMKWLIGKVVKYVGWDLSHLSLEDRELEGREPPFLGSKSQHVTMYSFAKAVHICVEGDKSCVYRLKDDRKFG